MTARADTGLRLSKQGTATIQRRTVRAAAGHQILAERFRPR